MLSWSPCPSLLSVALIKTLTSTNLGRKGLLCLTGHSPSSRETEDEPRAITEAWTTEEHCLQACSQAPAQIPQTSLNLLPRGGTIWRALIPPSISNQEKAHLQGYGGTSPTEVPSSRVSLVVLLTKGNEHSLSFSKLATRYKESDQISNNLFCLKAKV